MAEKQPPSRDVPLDAPIAVSPETTQQLAESAEIRGDAEVKRQRAEETASEMSRILRRLAEAIDRNPQSWDALLGRRER
jgi:hypothetical protein